ncbi:hypothetical protein GCM10019059_40830 [Camelimonas fluminis]|uniref:Morphogenetic protein n=1 Tax=Camelimonas fluminis TaxID=1576911 RepID=A0ABV7UBL5_9HYPH|nr:hypothetical protein [Camelimonas fluminis]GHE77683.1 hypothetical protein GCM10019059_40830 [Camelimonas fluminis]
MADRPIQLPMPMINALLDGRKTQLRQKLDLPTKAASGGAIYERSDMGGWEPGIYGGRGCFTVDRNGTKHPAPEMVGLYHRTCGVSILAPIQVGDQFWVREVWCDLTTTHGRQTETYNSVTGLYERRVQPFIWYQADGDQPDIGNGAAKMASWRSPRRMPRSASRLTLLVTDVRAQLLSDISEEDAVAEGVERDSDGWRDYLMPSTQCCFTARDSYKTLWDSMNGPGSWNATPWIAAYSFDVVRENIDRFNRSA